MRAWSEDVPGLILSNHDVDGVLADVPSALSVILSHRLDTEVVVEPLSDIREILVSNGVVPPKGFTPGPKEYVAYRH